MSTITKIDKHEELSVKGCEFFIKANESFTTRISTNKLRWLSIKKNGDYISSTQRDACMFIENIIKQYGNADWDKLNLKILLYENPIKNQEEYIKKLIKCGADVRFFNAKERTRIMTQKNVVFITFSTKDDKVVNYGIYYVGDDTSIDPYIDYWNKQFDSIFNKARKVILKDNTIVFADKFIKSLWKTIKDAEFKEWIMLFLGAVIGAIFGWLFQFL